MPPAYTNLKHCLAPKTLDMQCVDSLTPRLFLDSLNKRNCQLFLGFYLNTSLDGQGNQFSCELTNIDQMQLLFFSHEPKGLLQVL